MCKHLLWVRGENTAEVKRNVNCDLYEKKGKCMESCEDKRLYDSDPTWDSFKKDP